MRRISDTIARLAASRGSEGRGTGWAHSRLTPMNGFGSNPGALLAKIHLPAGMAEYPALVVVLHGCTQTAEAYDVGSGWSQLADRHGFALLFPEQQRQNNANLCFNWFAPEDSRRGHGEALSIRQMVDAMVERHGVDPARVFVTGLSAGGAMASVMLATYPEVFAGGAIIAGLPFGCAASVPEAFDRMRGHGMPRNAQLAASLRHASPHRGPWPIVSVWHGSGDTTVSPSNADAIVEQWRSVHGLAAAPSRTEIVDGHPRRSWSDASGRVVIEEYRIAGMGHGTPLAVGEPDGCGASGAFMLEANISSTRHICRFWGLAPEEAAVEAQARSDRNEHTPSSAARVPANAEERVGTDPGRKKMPADQIGIGKIIEDALRSAGLMRQDR